MIDQSAADTWILGLYAFLAQKYGENAKGVDFQVRDSTVFAVTDGTYSGRILANEIWNQRSLLTDSGTGLKVVTGGKTMGFVPPVNSFCGDSMLLQAKDVLSMTDSTWLKRQSRGVYPNLQRIESIQRNDGTVYLVSAKCGDNNVIKGVFPFLSLQKVLSAPVAELVGKPVNWASSDRLPGDDDPTEIGKIRARVIREGIADGYYAESYEFRYQGVKYKMECEYLSLDSDEEAIVVVRNLDLFQKGYWMQIKESLS